MVSDGTLRESELEKRLDAEMRLAGDLEAALRFTADRLDEPLDPLGRVQLRAYILKELKRLCGR